MLQSMIYNEKLLWLLVYEKILDAATSAMSPVDVPLEILLHFVSSLPREFTEFGGRFTIYA